MQQLNTQIKLAVRKIKANGDNMQQAVQTMWPSVAVSRSSSPAVDELVTGLSPSSASAAAAASASVKLYLRATR